MVKIHHYELFLTDKDEVDTVLSQLPKHGVTHQLVDKSGAIGFLLEIRSKYLLPFLNSYTENRN